MASERRATEPDWWVAASEVGTYSNRVLMPRATWRAQTNSAQLKWRATGWVSMFLVWLTANLCVGHCCEEADGDFCSSGQQHFPWEHIKACDRRQRRDCLENIKKIKSRETSLNLLLEDASLLPKCQQVKSQICFPVEITTHQNSVVKLHGCGIFKEVLESRRKCQ